MDNKIRKLISYYKPYLPLFFADMFFAILGAAITLIIPLIVRYITGNVILQEPQEAMQQILKLGIFMVVLVGMET